MLLAFWALVSCLFASPAMAADAVTIPCGGAEMTIQCRGPLGGTDCTRTALRLKAADGTTRRLPPPDEFSDARGISGTGAIGLSCGTARNGSRYFVVDYGELPFGCDYCEWFKVYALNGTELTRNKPAILTEKSLPEGHQAYPNNKDYAAFLKKVGLKRGDSVSVRCDPKPPRPAGHAVSECELQR